MNAQGLDEKLEKDSIPEQILDDSTAIFIDISLIDSLSNKEVEKEEDSSPPRSQQTVFSDKVRNKIIRAAHHHFNEYYTKAKFCYDKKCSAFKKTRENYYALFDDEAQVIDDITGSLDVLNYKDYYLLVLEYLENRGVPFYYWNPSESRDYNKIEIIDKFYSHLVADVDDYDKLEYFCSFNFIKVMQFSLDKENKVKDLNLDEEREIPLSIRMVMDRDFKNVKIISITLLVKENK